MDATNPLGALVTFRVKEGLSRSERTKFFRSLYGYLERSNFSRYAYPKEGLLESVPHVSLVRAAFIVAEENERKVARFLRKACHVKTRKVVLTPSDRRRLYGPMPK